MKSESRLGIASLLKWVAGTTFVLVTVLPACGYFFVKYEELAHSLKVETRLQAVVLSRIVNRNSQVWKFQSERLKEGLQELHNPARSMRILDTEGLMVADLGSVVAQPAIERSAEFYEYGVKAGTIRSAASLLPILKVAGLILLATTVLGFVVFVPLRAIPLRELERSNNALLSRNREYRTLVEGLAEGLILSERTGVVVTANPAAARVFGMPRELLIGRNLTQLLSTAEREDGSPFDPAAWFPASDNGEVMWVEKLGLRHGDGDGKIVWLLVRARPAVDPGNRPSRIMVSFEDITQSKRLEEMIRLNADLEQRIHERSAKLEETIQELETFSYSISHDLQSPLRAVIGFSKMLAEKYTDQLDATAKDYLYQIRAGETVMSKVIDNLLALAQVSRHELRIRQVDLSALAWQVFERLCASDPARAVTINIPAGLHGRCDAHLMRVVLEELIGNAWKFTARTPSSCIEVGESHENGEQIYFVRDNGAGFDQEFAGKLFVPFLRLHTHENFEGAGIGLAKVRRIVERHGGRIWAEGKVGSGATFSFTLYPTSR